MLYRSRIDTTFVLVMRIKDMIENKSVVVAVSVDEVVAGTVYSVVLRKIGVTPRKLGTARLKGKGRGEGFCLVRGMGGKVWNIGKVELLRVEGREDNVRGGKDAFRIIR